MAALEASSFYQNHGIELADGGFKVQLLTTIFVYLGTLLKPLIFHLSQIENQWLFSVPIFKPDIVVICPVLGHLKINYFLFGTMENFTF